MADAAAFDWICNRLEQNTSLDRLESRGTIRLALKSAGLEARSVTPDQLGVVIEKRLVEELRARGVDDCEDVCARLAAGLESEAASLTTGGAAETPDAVFSRLGGTS
jgi:hypothetical protein